MPRYKESARHQSLLLPVQLLHQLQPGTFEYAVDHIVDHVLDLSGLDARYANDAAGAPAYNPRALLKVILFAYSRGITSSRQIEDACRENVVFMSLAGENKPAYTTIASFLRSMADAIEPLFRDVLLYCDQLGLIGKSMFAIDGRKGDVLNKSTYSPNDVLHRTPTAGAGELHVAAALRAAATPR